jgi:hypothetical protein
MPKAIVDVGARRDIAFHTQVVAICQFRHHQGFIPLHAPLASLQRELHHRFPLQVADQNTAQRHSVAHLRAGGIHHQGRQDGILDAAQSSFVGNAAIEFLKILGADGSLAQRCQHTIHARIIFSHPGIQVSLSCQAGVWHAGSARRW